MKKVLTILVVLALFAGFAFADGNTVTLITELDKIAPSFKLEVKDGETFTMADTTVADLDTVGGITAEFKVSQVGPARLANGTAPSLGVSCGAFYLYDGGNKVAAVHTADPTVTITGEGLGNAAVRTNLTFNDVAISGNAITFSPKYNGNVEEGAIGSFKANWVQRTDLPAGTYKADVELTYTAL